MPTGYYPAFETVLIDASGVRSMAASQTLNVTDITHGGSLATRSSNSSGVVAEGSYSLDPGTVIEFSHATYPGKMRYTLQATQELAYRVPENHACAFVLRNLANLAASKVVKLHLDDGTTPTYEIGDGERRTTVLIPVVLPVAKTVDIVPESFRDKEGSRSKGGLNYDLGVSVSIPAATPSQATVSQILTGTDDATYITPLDLYEALWKSAPTDTSFSAGVLTLGQGQYFRAGTATDAITDIDWGTSAPGRWGWILFQSVRTLTYNASTLILPTGANIITAAGDTALFFATGSDQVTCVAYQRGDGTALAGSEVLFQTVTHVATTSTSLQTLYSVSIPAGQFANDGDKLHIRVWGRAQSNTNSRRLDIDAVGASANNLFSYVSTVASHDWHMDIVWVRESSSVLGYSIDLGFDVKSEGTLKADTVSITTTDAITFRLRAQSAVTGEIELFHVSGVYYPAA